MCPLRHWGEVGRRSQQFSEGTNTIVPLGPLSELGMVLLTKPRVLFGLVLCYNFINAGDIKIKYKLTQVSEPRVPLLRKKTDPSVRNTR